MEKMKVYKICYWVIQMLNKNLWTIEQIAAEVEILLKYTMEMKVLTRYKGGGVPKFQMLNTWTNNILKKR